MRQRWEQEHRKQVEDKAEYILKILPSYLNTIVHTFTSLRYLVMNEMSIQIQPKLFSYDRN